jgi:hypothetical protein
MLTGLIAFAADVAEGAGHEEPSKTAFYILGGLLAVYAVVISFIGMRTSFPGSKAQRGLMMAVSSVLVAAALVASVATA